MPLDFAKLIDLDKMQTLFELNMKLTGISSALIALDGTIYAHSGWKKICSQFHLANPDSARLCASSYEQACNRLHSGEPYLLYTCPFGLVDIAVPVRINGKYVANLMYGRFFHEEPDPVMLEGFKRQAGKFGFDEKEYMEAVSQIPVIPELKLEIMKESMLLFVEMIGGMGVSCYNEQTVKEQIISAYGELQKEIRRRKSEEEKLRQIIEGNAIPTFVIDTESRITHWNKACEFMTGFSASEMTGTDRHQEVFYSSKRPLLVDLLVRNISRDEILRFYGDKIKNMSQNTDSYQGEDLFPEIGDKGKTLFYTAASLKDADGRITGAITTLQDVTDIRQAEHELRESEERYRHLFESANDAILLVRDGRITDCNQKALFLFRCSRDELIGSLPIDLSPGIQPGGEISAEELRRKSKIVYQDVPLTFEWRFIRKEGTFFDSGVSVSQIMISDTAYALAIIRDISGTKQLIHALRTREAELDDKTRYLEKVNQALKASLDHREVERRAVEESMLSNMKQFVFPYFRDIAKCRIDQDARVYLGIIETNLGELVSPISRSRFARYIDLTPTEIKIADLIRDGKNTKETAVMLGLSPSSVQWHRKNIREKFSLTNKKTNLQTFLKTLS